MSRPRKNNTTLPRLNWLDATSERLSQSNRLDIDSSTNTVYDTSGFRTKEKRRSFTSPIDTAFRKQWISGNQYLAGQTYLDHLYKANIDGNITSSIDGMPTHRFSKSISNNRLHHLSLIIYANKSIAPAYSTIWLNWCQGILTNNSGISILGFMHRGQGCRATLRSVGKDILNDCLSNLSDHYRFN